MGGGGYKGQFMVWQKLGGLKTISLKHTCSNQIKMATYLSERVYAPGLFTVSLSRTKNLPGWQLSRIDSASTLEIFPKYQLQKRVSKCKS